MLMRHEQHGWHDTTGAEVEAMKKSGWIESSYEEMAAIAKQKRMADNPAQSIDETEGNIAQPSGEPAKRRGRPPR